MKHNDLWIVVVLVIASVQLSACAQTAAVTASKVAPAKVERIEGTNLNRLTLIAEASKRLNIQTAPVRDAQVSGVQRKVIPYAAVLYDTQGNTWAYTNPEPLRFVRQSIKIDRIEGDLAVLTDGPPSGTAVVTVGVAELFGIEFGVGK